MSLVFDEYGRPFIILKARKSLYFTVFVIFILPFSVISPLYGNQAILETHIMRLDYHNVH